MSKLANLQTALNSSTGRKNTEAAAQLTVRAVATVIVSTPSSKAPTRAGKKNVAAWLPSDFRLVQAKLPGDPSLENLLA